MTLDEAKAAMESAAEQSKAAPTDKTLALAAAEAEKAYNDAVTAGQSSTKEKPAPSDEDGWDEKTKAYIKKLRDENAGHRRKNKELASTLNLSETQKTAMLKAAGIEGTDTPPEEVISSLSADNQNLAFSKAVLGIALEHGIPADDVDFLEFAIAKAGNELAEGEELSDDKLAEIVAKVKGRGTKTGSTSVGTGTTKTPPPGATDQVGLDDFCRMSVTQKSSLFLKNPTLYESLKNEAKGKKRFV